MIEFRLEEWLSGDDSFYTHLGVFLSLILGGFGFPIPEDLPLMAGGLAASKNIVSFKSIFVTSYVGVVIADQIIFAIGYFFGPKLIEAGNRSRFFPTFKKEKLAKIKKGLRKNRFFYIFIGRHLFPLRTATFLSAGTLRIPYLEFLLADLIAAFVSVTIMLSIGYLLGEIIPADVWTAIIKKIHIYLTVLIVGGGLAYFFRRRWKLSKRARSIKSHSQK